MSLSENAIEALTAPETSQVFLLTATVAVDGLVTAQIVNNTESIVSGGITYEPVAFEFVLPGTSDSGVKSASVVIDNVDRRMSEILTKSAGKRITAEFNIILAETPDVIERGPMTFCLRNVQVEKKSIKADLYDFYLTDLNIPGLQYTPKNFPGLF